MNPGQLVEQASSSYRVSHNSRLQVACSRTGAWGQRRGWWCACVRAWVGRGWWWWGGSTGSRGHHQAAVAPRGPSTDAASLHHQHLRGEGAVCGWHHGCAVNSCCCWPQLGAAPSSASGPPPPHLFQTAPAFKWGFNRRRWYASAHPVMPVPTIHTSARSWS